MESRQGAGRFSDSAVKVLVNLVKSDSPWLAARWQQVFGLHGGSDMGMGPNLSPSPLPGCFVVLILVKLTQVMKASLIGAIHPSSARCESQFKQALLHLSLFSFFLFPIQDG